VTDDETFVRHVVFRRATTLVSVKPLEWKNTLSVFTRHSLDRAKGEVFVLLYVYFVCSLFCQWFLDNAGRFTPNFACGRILVPDVSSPLLGVSGPRRAEKGGMKFSLLWSQWGIFAFWWFSSDISATRGRIHTKFYICRDNVCRRAPSPLGSIGPNGGFVSVLLTHLFFLTLPHLNGRRSTINPPPQGGFTHRRCLSVCVFC